MSPNAEPDGFEETDQLPRGRKAREVPRIVWEKLEHSAKTGRGIVKKDAPLAIAELKKDLGSAEVRKKYHVTVGTVKHSDTLHELTFAAKHRLQPTAAASSPAANSAAR
jgi:hypothetical protein